MLSSDRIQPPNINTLDKVKALATNSSDIEVISSRKCRTLPLDYVLKQLKLEQHAICGDGSCLFHAIAHQAGFIEQTSQGNPIISNHLRFLVVKTMTEHPDVRLEDGLSVTQWSERKQKILNVSEWGGDLEIRLLAIALHRDIVVLTCDTDGSYGRRFPCKLPPLPKMRGGVFIPITSDELCNQWQSASPSPLLIIFNGSNHYNSTIKS